MIKVSICLAFIRIFFTSTFRHAATVIYSLCIGWSVSTILVGYLICTPLSRLWTQTTSGHCGSPTAAYISLGVLDVVLDIAVFALPMPCLYKLQVPKNAKIPLVATFALGLFTIVAGIMRLVSVIRIDFTSDFDQGQVGDAYWCAVEGSVGTIVACAMTLRPLLDRMLNFLGERFPRLFTNNRRSAANETSGSSLAKPRDEGLFVRLRDIQEIAMQDFTEGCEDGGKDHTKRASYEDV